METYPYGSTEWHIIQAMEAYGGGFIKQLAKLYRMADKDNQKILENAFKHYFIKYDEIAHLMAK